MVEEVGSGASERLQQQERLWAARRPAIDALVVWRLDRWGRSVADLVGTLYELQVLGVGFIGGMVLRRTPHAVYDTLYHMVWSPKYRRDVLQGEVQQRIRERFADIAEQYDITIEGMAVSPDHVHLFCSFPPRYSIALHSASRDHRSRALTSH